MVNVKAVPSHTTHVLATAHALVKLDEDVTNAAGLTGKPGKTGDATIVGDPMEKTTLEALGWQLKTSDIIEPAAGLRSFDGKTLPSVNIRRRFQFSSALKRMSTVSTAGKGGKTLVCNLLINSLPPLLNSSLGIGKGCTRDYQELLSSRRCAGMV